MLVSCSEAHLILYVGRVLIIRYHEISSLTRHITESGRKQTKATRCISSFDWLSTKNSINKFFCLNREPDLYQRLR